MRVAICDDEAICRERIIELLAAYEAADLEIAVSEFCCGEDLIRAYENGDIFDVAFLDVEMQNVSGVDAGHIIREMDSHVMFIFVTAHMKYVPEAFRLNAFQFLIKPLTQQVFNLEFDRAVSTYRTKKFKYRIDFKDETIHLEIKDILYIETFGRRLKAVTKSENYEYYGNIRNEEKKLSAYNFVRIHQGCLVNMYFIRKLEKNALFLLSGHEIPISKGFKNLVMEKYNKFISGCSI